MMSHLFVAIATVLFYAIYMIGVRSARNSNAPAYVQKEIGTSHRRRIK
jgi:hypothetical protein